VFSAHETGISTFPNKSSKIIGLKGKRRVGILSSVGRRRRRTTTVDICSNAAGQYILLLY
jgi:hypothetical protein